MGRRKRRTWGSGAVGTAQIDTICLQERATSLLTVYFVVLPSQALRDTDSSPFLLAQQPQCATLVRVKECLWDHLEERFGKDDVTILILIVGVAI